MKSMQTMNKVHAANLLSLNYVSEAGKFAQHPYRIIDAHTHLIGCDSIHIYKRVAELYGVGLTYAMTPLDQIDAVRSVLGNAVRFIAVPDFGNKDLQTAFGVGYRRQLSEYHAKGARIAKFWSAPRRHDMEQKAGTPGVMQLNSPHTFETMAVAVGLGMSLMVHVGDPDTWFATKYVDQNRYGTKSQQYEPLEEVLERFPVPLIAAHMGGWPENLTFLSELLERHDNLYLDTSATKWMVRELSKHPQAVFLSFLNRWRGRILFGSDIVTNDKHLVAATDETKASQAAGPEQAFDLYASRYWALRKLLETDIVGPSPIADPDLAMADPERFTPLDAPLLVGKHLPPEILQSLFHDAADDLLEPLFVEA